jgi:hypothetical protein
VAQSGSKNIEEFKKIKLLPHLNFSQIWLNLPVDHTTLATTQNCKKEKTLIGS